MGDFWQKMRFSVHFVQLGLHLVCTWFATWFAFFVFFSLFVSFNGRVVC